ncbi:MAG TPA: ATP-binding protein [Nonomuraea sp.]|nr:ATP-binding protein [Nonomuraea sp.]
MEPPAGRLSRDADLACDFDRGSLVAVRREVERISRERGLTDLALYRFLIAVNEIMTNAVRHGGGRGRLTLWRAGGRLFCRVDDRGPGMAPPPPYDDRPPPPDSMNGRGLWLARRNVAGFTLRTGPDGTSITLEAGPPA